MERTYAEGKRSLHEAEEEDEEENEGFGDENMNTKRKRAFTCTSSASTISASTTVTPSSCQAEDCISDMSNSKLYYRRHKVCEFHSKAPVVVVAGLRKRFCQQCSRFHELSEFDETKRSCRRRLAGHNERRRKSSYDSSSQGEGPS